MRFSAYDEHSKNLLSLLLEAHGRVKSQKRVRSHVQYADLAFLPRARRSAKARALEPYLGLLNRYLDSPVFFEHFSSPPDEAEIRACLRKLFNFMAHRETEARRKQRTAATGASQAAQVGSSTPREPADHTEDVPIIPDCRLVLLLAVPAPAVQRFLPTPVKDSGAPTGLYPLAPGLHTEILVISELPETLDTLWFRMTGRGEVYARAIQAFSQLPADHPLRSDVMNLLVEHYELMISIDEDTLNDEDDEEELRMYTSPILDRYNNRLRKKYLEEFQQELVPQIVLDKTQQVLLNILQVRFGTADSVLERVAQQLAQLDTSEATRLSLQLSREELTERFAAA